MNFTQSFRLRTAARFPRGFALLLALSLANVCVAQRPPERDRGGGASSWLKQPVTAERLRHETFESAAAKSKVSYLIYTPAEYDTAKDKRFPVMYWLHGVNAGWQGAPAMVERFDKAIAAGKTPPMLVVFVNGLPASMYCDSKDGKQPVETVIVKELVPHIDATYRTVARREGRLIEGFSMGGFGATHLGFKHHEIFGAVSSLAGALQSGGGGDIFERVFGGDRDYYEANTPWKLAQLHAAVLKMRTVVRLAGGDRDRTLEVNKQFDAHLTQSGIPHEFDVLPGVGHDPNAIYEALGEKNWAFYRKVFGTLDKAAPSASASGETQVGETPKAQPPAPKTDSPPSASSETGRRQRPQFTFDQWLQRFDTNKDGKVGKDEFTGPPQAFQRMDANSDGIVDQSEFEKSRQGQPRAGSPGAGGRPQGGGGKEKMGERVESQGVKAGGMVPDADVFTLEGKAVRLSSLWKEKPLVLVTVSITCPIAVDSCPSLKPLKELHDARVNFAILYVREAHPAGDGKARSPGKRTESAVASGFGSHAQPSTLAERRELAALFHKHFGNPVPVYVADIQNAVPQKLGTGSNTGLLIGTDGKLLTKHGWYDADAMRQAIAKLLAPDAAAKGQP